MAEISTERFSVKNLDCASCAAKIENGYASPQDVKLPNAKPTCLKLSSVGNLKRQVKKTIRNRQITKALWYG